jgi:hypothetical protein
MVEITLYFVLGIIMFKSGLKTIHDLFYPDALLGRKNKCFNIKFRVIHLSFYACVRLKYAKRYTHFTLLLIPKVVTSRYPQLGKLGKWGLHLRKKTGKKTVECGKNIHG